MRPRGWHTIAMLVLLLGSAALYFHNLDFGLPDFLFGDEGPRWIQVEQLLARGRRLQNPYYPPGWEVALAGQKLLLDFITPGALDRSAFIFVGRFSSSALGLFALALLYDIGRRFGAPLAGLFAAGFLAVYPVHVQHAHLIKPDVAANALGILALWAALVGLDRGDGWFAVSLLAGLLAFVTKYTALAAIGLPFLAVLVKYFRQSHKLLVVGGPLLLAAIVALGLLHWRMNLVESILNVRYDFPETTESVTSRAATLEFPGVDDGISLIAGSLGAPLLVTSLALFPIVLVARGGWKPPTIRRLIVVAAYGLAVFATFSVISPVYLRYYLPAVVAIALIWGLALAWALPRRWSPLVAIPVAAYLLLPFARESLDRVAWFGRQDTLALATSWFVENVPQGARIAVDGQARDLYFRRYSGYAGPLVYNATDYGPLPEQNIEALAGGGVSYVVASKRDSRDHFAEFEELRIVADIQGDGRRGPPVLIVELPPLPENERFLWFGDDLPEKGHETPPIQLRGYDPPDAAYQSGSTLEFALYWMSAWPTGVDYLIETVVVESRTGRAIVAHEAPPGDGQFPTSSWLGDMQFFSDRHSFPLPPDLSPGDYAVQIAIRDPASGQPLPVTGLDGRALGDSFLLGEITITP